MWDRVKRVNSAKFSRRYPNNIYIAQSPPPPKICQFPLAPKKPVSQRLLPALDQARTRTSVSDRPLALPSKPLEPVNYPTAALEHSLRQAPVPIALPSKWILHNRIISY